jgi:hypothetical protein
MNLIFDPTVTVGVIVTIVLAVVGWVQMGRKATNERIGSVVARLDRHDTRLQSLEQTVTGLPAKDHIHDLKLELAAMKGELKAMSAVMEGNAKIMLRLENIVTRHEDHLLDGGRK